MTVEAGGGRRDTRRRFEQWARNPACAANTISSILGIPMRDVAVREGTPDTSGQSPFALARGQTFEASLLRNAGERIFEALIAAEVLPHGASGLLDLRLRRHGGPMADLDAAIAATGQHLAESAAGRDGRARPFLLAGAAVSVPGAMMLPEAVLVIDLLVLRRDLSPVEIVVGEVKTYPDRGGYTDGEQLATARAQAGVYAHGLELTLADLGLAERLRVSHRGFLVLSRPGSNMPSVRADEDLRYQVERARRGFELLRSLARELGTPHEDPVQLVCEARTAYSETCVSFCERSIVCRERALERGNPAVLGEAMAHWLGDVSLHRAVALLAGDSAKTPAEQDLAERLREMGMLA